MVRRALSVLISRTLSMFLIETSIKFCEPIILVLTVSNGLYSVTGTCFNAAVWITTSTSSSKAQFNLDLSLISPIKNLKIEIFFL